MLDCKCVRPMHYVWWDIDCVLVVVWITCPKWIIRHTPHLTCSSLANHLPLLHSNRLHTSSEESMCLSNSICVPCPPTLRHTHLLTLYFTHANSTQSFHHKCLYSQSIYHLSHYVISKLDFAVYLILSVFFHVLFCFVFSSFAFFIFSRFLKFVIVFYFLTILVFFLLFIQWLFFCCLIFLCLSFLVFLFLSYL